MSEPHEHPPWVEGKTIGEMLRATARRLPQRDAVVFSDQQLRWTYEDFDRQVDQAARGLLALGLKRGEHLAVWATNVPEWVLLQFATARVGVVLVTVNPAYRAHELRYVLRQSDAVALAVIERFKSSAYFDMLDDVCPRLKDAQPGTLQDADLPKLRWVVSLAENKRPGMIDWSELIEGASRVSDEALARREAELSADDPINIQYTSGTTGFPKGAMLTHRNILLNAYHTGACQRLNDQDRICIPVPLYHCFGCVLGTLCAATHGAAMVFPAQQFDPAATLHALEQERCTVAYGVPTMFIAQLEHKSFAERQLGSLRTGIMAGSPCPLEVMKRVIDVMGCGEITIAYGLTEASPVITQTRAEDPIELRVGTVGRPIPGVEVKIVDAESGDTVPAGQQGELCARGHGVMRGYYNMPEESARAIDADGWLHTGDLAIVEPNGYYRITGRLKDMVIRGGENIYPREIEEFLYRHPKVEDVQVVGVPDRKYGEELLACVKLRAGEAATEDEMRAFCRQSLAHYKVPRYIQFVDSYPMTVTGKIQKYKIREQAIQQLGLEAT